MIHLVKYIIVFIAISIALVLIFFGVKKLNIKTNKTQNIFILTILSVLTLNSCTNNTTNEQTNSQIVINSKTMRKQSDRINKLNKTTEWTDFKTFWQKLDNIKPEILETNIDGKTSKIACYNYGFDKDRKKYQQLIDDLQIHIQKLSQIKLITENELKALEVICNERIKHLFLFNSLLISHMIPPQINTNIDNSLEKLELKIDTLIQLKNDKILNEDEYNKSLEKINNEVNNVITISTILSNYQGKIYEGGFFDDNTQENNKQYFEQHFKKRIDTEGENGKNAITYSEITAKLDDIENSFLTLDELINDLVSHN